MLIFNSRFCAALWTPSGCEPTGHAYSAAISACAAAGDWSRAVALFDEMTGPAGIRPDVVSCTALITALAAGGEADRAEAVVGWMLANAVRPNARTYTALMAALGNAKRWGRAVEVLRRMQSPEWGCVQPNAYTYSALLKVSTLMHHVKVGLSGRSLGWLIHPGWGVLFSVSYSCVHM